ncbi:hypothetical protein NFC81_12915 [Salinispirillum sp. LH 10-3-1]|uniref:Uncharacterized protein n=1 Tax=Salinispirillum sp. LH 10-3-1 TaxID=2952525 RepID=A0AB38YE05_9GAMM
MSGMSDHERDLYYSHNNERVKPGYDVNRAPIRRNTLPKAFSPVSQTHNLNGNATGFKGSRFGSHNEAQSNAVIQHKGLAVARMPTGTIISMLLWTAGAMFAGFSDAFFVVAFCLLMLFLCFFGGIKTINSRSSSTIVANQKASCTSYNDSYYAALGASLGDASAAAAGASLHPNDPAAAAVAAGLSSGSD